jgi:CRAL/TRIO domain
MCLYDYFPLGKTATLFIMYHDVRVVNGYIRIPVVLLAWDYRALTKRDTNKSMLSRVHVTLNSQTFLSSYVVVVGNTHTAHTTPSMGEEEPSIARTVALSLGTGYFDIIGDDQKVIFSKRIRPSHEEVVGRKSCAICRSDYGQESNQVNPDQSIKAFYQVPKNPPASSKSGKTSDVRLIPGTEWSDETVNRIVELWELSTDARTKFIELGHQLKDVGNHSKNNPADVVRFFIANSGDINRAERQFRNMVLWRKQHDVDQILQNYTPPKDLVNYFPGAVLQGLDKDGDPIFLSRVGVTDAAGMLQRYGHEEMIKHAIWLRELLCTGQWMQQYEKVHNKPVKRAIVIEDVHEIQLFPIVSNRPLLSLYAEIMRLDQDNYPEAAKKIFIIRAPVLFRLVWNIVQHFFDTNVREKMVFTGRSNFIEVLSQHIDIAVLPSCVVPEIGKGSPLEGMPPNFEGGPLPQ